MPDEFGLCRYLAAGLATLQVVDPGLSVDLSTLADELDAEALRNSAGRELFTNPAKTLAERMSGRGSRWSATCRDAGAGPPRRFPCCCASPTGSVPRRTGRRGGGAEHVRRIPDREKALFHDEEIDGPLPERLRVLALTLARRAAGGDRARRRAARRRPDRGRGRAGSPEVRGTVAAPARAEHQLATLAVRLEMAAVYLRLVRG